TRVPSRRGTWPASSPWPRARRARSIPRTAEPLCRAWTWTTATSWPRSRTRGASTTSPRPSASPARPARTLFPPGRCPGGAGLLTAAAGPEAPRWQARALFGDALLAWSTGDHATARERFEASIPLWRGTTELAGLGHSLHFLSVELLGSGEVDAAKRLSLES